MHYLDRTMPSAWWQDTYVSCYAAASCFCGILIEVTNLIKRTTPQGAGNTERGLTIMSGKETIYGYC